ncbi:hypothetical protein GGI07_001313 [Coemansia sp. Benny D115]|nr:hypothetical protein GGI07_001313 [Coemansia sp. Benny D115]
MPNIDQNHPAVRQIKSNPRVMETMKKAMELMHRKGYIDLSNPSPPSFMSMMKMLADSEIKKTIAEMQAVMKEEGIGFKPEDLAVFINSGAGGFSPPKDDGVRMKESGVDEKGAGLFERISKSIKGRS